MNNQGNQAIKHFSRTESTSKIVIDQSELKLETRMPSFKGNKTPYINSDSKKFTKSIYKWDFGDAVMSNYLQEDTKFQLPSAVKSRDNNQLPSERQSEKYLWSWTSEKKWESHINYFCDSRVTSSEHK